MGFFSRIYLQYFTDCSAMRERSLAEEDLRSRFRVLSFEAKKSFFLRLFNENGRVTCFDRSASSDLQVELGNFRYTASESFLLEICSKYDEVHFSEYEKIGAKWIRLKGDYILVGENVDCLEISIKPGTGLLFNQSSESVLMSESPLMEGLFEFLLIWDELVSLDFELKRIGG